MHPVFYSSAIVAGLVFIYMLQRIVELKRELKEKDIIMCDTSGIPMNTPEMFIDVYKNKTINFKLGKYAVKICQLPPLLCLSYLEKIATLWKALKVQLEYTPTGKMDKLKHDVIYVHTYNAIIYLIYKLSFQFVNNRIGYKKALYKKSKKDIIFICNVCEQVFDYWLYVKKKIQYLSKGTTLQQMAGGQLSWDSLKLDGSGKISLKPRFVPLSNIQQN